MYLSERRVELISHILKRSPRSIIDDVAELRSEELVQAVSNILSWLFGCAIGRWDVRFATGEKEEPELPDPFAPLPVCPPGMLQTNEGLPYAAEDIHRLRGAGEWHYPLELSADGILVDDAENANDMLFKLRAVLI